MGVAEVRIAVSDEYGLRQMRILTSGTNGDRDLVCKAGVASAIANNNVRCLMVPLFELVAEDERRFV